MKIFIGCEDMASILSGLAEGFRSIGHTTTTVVFSKNKYYPEIEYNFVLTPPLASRFNYLSKKLPPPFRKIIQRADRNFLNFQLRRKAWKWIESYDLFIFIWQPWLPEEELFERIKSAGKKIICIHVGSDVRHISPYKQEFNEDVTLWEQFFHSENLNEKIKKIRYHEVYADAIYSVPDQAGLAIRPYNHIFIPISKKKNFQFTIPARKVPLIVHAPSRSGIKGTALILDALDKLKREGYAFDLEIIQNLKNEDLLKKLAYADILVDELLLHGPGVLSAEAMLSGCAVATRTLQRNKNIFDPPVLNITPQNVLQQLRRLLEDIDLRTELAKKGKEFVQCYNDPEHIAQTMIASLAKPQFHYEPTFYLEKFVLPQGVKLTETNKKMSYDVARKYYRGSNAHILRARAENLIS